MQKEIKKRIKNLWYIYIYKSKKKKKWNTLFKAIKWKKKKTQESRNQEERGKFLGL